ncbi:amidohydrolase family protein [Maricaulaceae bacterium EIL42A08]|nr:amidohydrolase family protein [Maricaulaceae bacterium EIL42A08]MCP2678399.1 amidohydrolase family protein [Maricaulaceae bacterium NA33B04]
MLKYNIVAGLGVALAVVGATDALAQDEMRDTIIHAGHLIAAPGEERVRQQVSIIVRGDEIVAIEDGFIEAIDADLVDLSDQWVMPGFIDAHVHITNQAGPARRMSAFTEGPADRAIDGVMYAGRTLRAGFTTVQDVGGDIEAVRALRDGIEAGDIVGPRMRIAGGSVTPTGGHGDVNGWAVHVLRSNGSPYACNGPDDCARAVRQLVQEGADVIKITATGGVMSSTGAGVEQQFFDEELAAIVEAAHMMGRRVTAHAHGVTGINSFLRAGGDSIEHGTYLDDESIRLFRRNDAVLVPTVMAGVWVAGQADAGWMTPFQEAKARAVGPQMVDMVRRAHEGGITIAFGTDSGVSAHGDNAQEFGLYVQAGMTEMEAIATATTVGAMHVGLEDEIGRIAPGFAADIIAVDGDPLADIDELLDVDFVMARGVVHKNE